MIMLGTVNLASQEGRTKMHSTVCCSPSLRRTASYTALPPLSLSDSLSLSLHQGDDEEPLAASDSVRVARLPTARLPFDQCSIDI